MSAWSFAETLSRHGLDLKPNELTTLQLNVTKLCNQACVHCHVDASPRRREMMTDAVVDRCLEVLASNERVKTLDLTGGAPELHPRFRELVARARELGKHVMVRHNLTVAVDPHPLTKASLADLADFFAASGVEVISSLPYHQAYFTDKQRGDGVFEKSLRQLKALNERGYGRENSGLLLNLVYNPVGAYLPPPQAQLELDYKKELATKYGIVFNSLFALTNLPIHRFRAQLVKAGAYEDYMERLVAAFNPEAAKGIMCRSLLSVAWDGRLFDCDFNQMLDMPLERTIFDFDADALRRRDIKVAAHCFGCTAGAGSSCGGTTA
jgi:radical SAM/Cys-rich protein